MSRVLIALFLIFSAQVFSQDSSSSADDPVAQNVDGLQEPLYTPFIERYMLDEIRQLRVDMAAQKHELIQQVVDREIGAVDRAITYATDTVTYFFYLIAGASSVLVLIGWSSIREIKERVHSLADEEISKLVDEYEQRLRTIEQQLSQRTQSIEENREEIELTREIQSLWLRAAQDTNPNSKIAIYDQILTLNALDCEALTYKADAVLELGEPQWAANLCHQALAVDDKNSHAFYQLACAYASMEKSDEAVFYLKQALQISDSYRSEMQTDAALNVLRDHPGFIQLLSDGIAKSPE
ncbi:TPR end-of-group domain-containing protein [Aurantivibrio plasticivorans]